MDVKVRDFGTYPHKVGEGKEICTKYTQSVGDTPIVDVCEWMKDDRRGVVTVLTQFPNIRLFLLSTTKGVVRAHTQLCRRYSYKGTRKLRTYYVSPQGPPISARVWQRGTR